MFKIKQKMKYGEIDSKENKNQVDKSFEESKLK